MSDLAIVPDDWLAKQTTSILGLFRKTAESIIEAGLIIAEVRARIEHGQYMLWVERHLPFTYKTAERYMQVAEQFAPHGTWIGQIVQFDPSALYLLSEPKAPQAAREMAIKLAESGHEITYTAAQNIIKQVKAEPVSTSVVAETPDHPPTSGDKGLGALLRMLLASIGAQLTFRTAADPEGDPIITASSGLESESGRDVGEVLRLLAARIHKSAPGAFAIDPEPHIEWAKAIGAGVASNYNFAAGTEERADLEAAAVAELTARCRAFQPSRVPPGGDAGGLLRGYAHQSIQKECRREAERLRNGGTYRTRREKGGLVVHGYSEGGE